MKIAPWYRWKKKYLQFSSSLLRRMHSVELVCSKVFSFSLSRSLTLSLFFQLSLLWSFFLIIITYNDGNRKLWWDEFAVLISPRQHKRKLLIQMNGKENTEKNERDKKKKVNLFRYGWVYRRLLLLLSYITPLYNSQMKTEKYFFYGPMAHFATTPFLSADVVVIVKSLAGVTHLYFSILISMATTSVSFFLSINIFQAFLF